ncbi:MAG: PorP/SprF family type IX secretion system membrane protein [Paludibacteraceae bacterium]|nr:PorP/SprF family type IX secretion system membrane protein [Paludibacteraceae bacterium]
MKPTIKFIIAAVAMVALACNVQAQNDFSLAEQLYSRIAINPAGTGNSSNVNIFSLNRFQYAGMTGEGAPFTTLLNVQTYFEKAKSGLGFSFSYDNSGVAYTQMKANISYAYQLNFGKGNLFSFGLGLGYANKMFDPTRHILEDESERSDLNWGDEVMQGHYFDANFGIEYSNKYFLIGASVTHIPGYFIKDPTTLNYLPNYYAYMRGYIPCGEKFKLSPAVLYYYTGNLPKSTSEASETLTASGAHVVDASLTGFIGKYFWIGLGYRTETTTYAMFGLEWNWLRVGYSCDLNLGKLNNISWTSHEVMLSFSIPTKQQKEWDDE